MWTTTLVFLSCAALVIVAPPAPYNDECMVGEPSLYDPQHAKQVKWYTVDLDEDPTTRWNHVVMDHRDDIVALIKVIKSLSLPIFHGKLIAWVDQHMGRWDKHFAEPYRSELAGIAEATNVTMGEIVLYNVFYEVFSVCTSIVAADTSGHLVHARNLDFGLFLGWDHTSHNWDLYERLQPLIVNVEWQRNQTTVFKSVNFAGYIGVYNGLKPNAFTITMNERFNINGGFIGILEWLLGLTSKDTTFSTFLVREAMLEAETYSEALTMMMSAPILAPAYYIVGGTKAPEAAIVTRGRNALVSVVHMDTSENDGWYVLQTNYDPGKALFYLDDRRTPGNKCMMELGSANSSFAGVYQVLSSKTNLNKLTEYTVLMQTRPPPGEVDFETHLQKCPSPCWPW